MSENEPFQGSIKPGVSTWGGNLMIVVALFMLSFQSVQAQKNDSVYVDWRISKGLNSMKYEHYHSALDAFLEAKKDYPEDIKLDYFIAECRFQVEDYDGLLKMNIDLSDFTHQNWAQKLNYFYGTAYEHYGELKKAEEHYWSAANTEPSYHEAWFALANLEKDKGKWENALYFFGRGKTLAGFPSPKNALIAGICYYHLDSLELSERWLMQAYDGNGSEKGTAAAFLGYNNYKKKQYETSIKWLKEAIRTLPLPHDEYLILANAFFKLDQLDAGLTYFHNERVKWKVTPLGLLHAIVQLQIDRKDLDSTDFYLARMKRIYPNCPDQPDLQLQKIHAFNLPDTREYWLEEWINCDPLNPKPVYYLIHYKNTHGGHFETSIQLLKKYKERLIHEPGKYYLNLCYQYSEAGLSEKAISLADSSLKYSKDPSIIYSNRGNAYRQLKNYQAAEADFGESMELNPENPYLWYNLARLHIDAGNLEKACKELKTAEQLGFRERYGSQVEALQIEFCP